MSDHEKARRQFWENVYIAVCSTSDCKEIELALSWADRAIKHWDMRWDKEKLTSTVPDTRKA